MIELILTVSLVNYDGKNGSIGNWKWGCFRSTEFSATLNLFLPSTERGQKRGCVLLMALELQAANFTYELGMTIVETLIFYC